MTAHFAANATAVNVMGVRVDGWDAMLAANRDGLAGIPHDQYARYEVADVRFLRRTRSPNQASPSMSTTR